MTEKVVKDFLKRRNEILEKRCERCRAIMRNEDVNDDKISKYLYSGELSLNDARYLEAGRKIPKEWLDEYNEISDRWEEKK